MIGWKKGYPRKGGFHMKRHLVRVLALAAAFLLTACAARLPSPEARRAPSTAESAVSAAPEALEPAPPLAVSLGDRAELVEAGAEAPVFPVSDPAELPLLPGGYAVTVTDAGGGTVFAGESGELGGFLPARNGGYAYEAAAGGTLYRFTVDCAFPVQLSLNAAARQGETVVLRTLYADGAELSAESDLGFSPRFFSAGDGSQIALLPVRYTTPAGVYGLTVTAGDEVLTREIVVEQREFEVQYLEMDAATAEETALSAAANAEWEEKVEPLKAVADPVQYWEGPFLQPVSGEITTQFGCIRYTNDDPTPSRHGGIDIAAKTGTDVLAANNGRVLFAERIQLTGNTVVIEHGYGLKSFYYHMDSLSVSAGDAVKKGDKIGEVGTTGYSTGPHLHFALAVNNVFVNPWTAFDPGI
ncbi:M23 family metallopeptidase [Anaerotruncus massiliensis (ex Liu et al. 2021)]|uniref:M23 family metallopeptidase n=2 Tax=Anaerotruncus TaxID=244127 RepID=A0A498CNY0_9FIRM|nr:M23 family metallopeptidase [Anaerotruncus massiliensis (ex Liu et al. 2021)]